MLFNKLKCLKNMSYSAMYQTEMIRRLMLRRGNIIVSSKLHNPTVKSKFYILPNHRSSSRENSTLSRFSFDDIRLQKYMEQLLVTYLEAQEKLNEESLEERTQPRLIIASLSHFVSLNTELQLLEKELKDLNLLISELENQNDDDFLKTATEEKNQCVDNILKCQRHLMQTLIPVQSTDDKDIIVEISAGVGGQEAMLFAKDLYDMYVNYATSKMWTCQLLKYDTTDLGGVRNAHIGISGQNTYKMLKFESGVHRVQRVPKTEKGGRIHTSTATVAVLPQPNEIDIVINPKDLETVFKTSSGAGGQNVNKTESCVRLIHKPSGITVECQVERFQYLNREIALKSLRAKLYERELISSQKETKSARKLQVGTAGRSEKVRTYNFLQDRITDHRIHENFYDVKSFLQGNETLSLLLEKLHSWSQAEDLDEILNNFDK